jgi:predicted permease
MLNELLAVIAPVFICAGVGAVWVRMGFDYPVDFVTKMVMNIAGPCLIISSLASMDADLTGMAVVVNMALLVMLVMGVVGWIIIRIYNLDIRSYLPPLLFPNTGNMGLSICMFAFGKEGLVLAVIYFLVSILAQLTLGVFIFSSGMGSWTDRLKDFIKQPMIHAMILGMIIIKLDLTLPRWADNTINLLGEMTIPLMLVTLGVSLASLKISAWRRGLIFSSIRVFGGLATAWLLCDIFAIKGMVRGVILLQSSMPVAVFNYLFAHRYNCKADDVAGMVLISTLLAFALLPFLVSYLIF